MVGIGKHSEDNHLGILVAELVQFHLVVLEQFAHFSDPDFHQTHVA